MPSTDLTTGKKPASQFYTGLPKMDYCGPKAEKAESKVGQLKIGDLKEHD